MSVCERVRGLVGHFSNRIRKERYLQSPVTCVIYILRGNQARDFSVCVVTLVACVCSPVSQVRTHTASLSEQLHVQRRYTPSLRHLVHRGVPQPIWCMRAARWRGGDRGEHPMSRQLDKLDSPLLLGTLGRSQMSRRHRQSPKRPGSEPPCKFHDRN